MKRILYPLLLLFVSVSAQAQKEVVAKQRQEIKNLQNSVSTLQSKNAALQHKAKTLEVKTDTLQRQLQILESSTTKSVEEWRAAASRLDAEIKQTSATIQTNQTAVQQSLQSKTLWGIIIALILLCIAAAVYLLLHKRISGSVSTIDKIKDSQRILQEESVKLDGKMVELLDGQMKLQKAQPAPAAATEPDHSLALKVADEIVRIETNLSRMDSSVKGYKPLYASVRRIKDNFMANGYEMVDMLGKPYKEGLKAAVTFVTDENLKDGEQIITRIIKPQVNYNGVMIQAAQIEVSQNE